MARAAVVLSVAALAAVSASALPLAAAGAWTPALQRAGFCVPAPEDGLYVPRTVGALGVQATATKPIAILDTGVDPATTQLAGRVLQGYDALTGAPLQGDPDGHGTQAAGLAASAGPGMVGISPASPVLPIRVYDPATRTSSAMALANGIGLAVAKRAGVVVISGSSPLSEAGDDDVRLLSTAVDAAFDRGVLTVVGAGDDGVADPALPASLPHVLVAGAATATPSRSSLVDTGPWLDLLVPAEGIEAPLPTGVCANGFGFSTGTSFAAPSLGGAAALVMARRPTLSTQQLFEVLRHAGTDIGTAGRDDDSGFGVLNVGTALSAPPLAREPSTEVDDDPYWVRGRFAKAHPQLLTRTKLRFKATGTVSPAKDPADVYRVSLAKRERVVVSVDAADPTALLELSILDPRAGDFDVTDGVDEFNLVSTGGLSSDPQVELTAPRSGTYYLAVEAADAVDPDDPTAVAPDLEPYTISAYKQRRSVKKKPARRTGMSRR